METLKQITRAQIDTAILVLFCIVAVLSFLFMHLGLCLMSVLGAWLAYRCQQYDKGVDHFKSIYRDKTDI